jgi:hypothetical protein
MASEGGTAPPGEREVPPIALNFAAPARVKESHGWQNGAGSPRMFVTPPEKPRWCRWWHKGPDVNYAYHITEGYGGLLLTMISPKLASKVYPWIASQVGHTHAIGYLYQLGLVTAWSWPPRWPVVCMGFLDV